jgi:hypothetical protein
MANQYIEIEIREFACEPVLHIADFTEMVLKSVFYRLSGCASQFLLLVMWLSGSQRNLRILGLTGLAGD